MAEENPMANMGQLFVMLPAIYLVNKIDFKEGDNLFYVRCAFTTLQVVVFFIRGLIWMRIKKKNDDQIIKVTMPGKPEGFGPPPPGEVVDMTIKDHDLMWFKKELQQAVMTLVIIGFIHYKWAVAPPLFLQLFMTPKTMWASNLFQLHILGNVKPRPFKEPENPLAALMGGGQAQEAEEAVAAQVAQATTGNIDDVASGEAATKKVKSKRSKKAD